MVLIHLKTDSPHLYRFTKLIIEKYNCDLIEDIDDLYSNENISDELKIKTHYESLDIAESKPNTLFKIFFARNFS